VAAEINIYKRKIDESDSHTSEELSISFAKKKSRERNQKTYTNMYTG